jgi:hypothetical protein
MPKTLRTKSFGPTSRSQVIRITDENELCAAFDGAEQTKSEMVSMIGPSTVNVC